MSGSDWGDLDDEIPDVPEDAYDDDTSADEEPVDDFGEPDFGEDASATTATTGVVRKGTIEEAAQGGAADEEEPPPPYFSSVGEFFVEYLAPLYRRHIDDRGVRWCPQWYLHDEVLVRVEALWRAWESLRLDPATGLSVWLRDHADHHMGVLFSSEGPFKLCNAGEHKQIKPVSSQELPAALMTPREGAGS